MAKAKEKPPVKAPKRITVKPVVKQASKLSKAKSPAFRKCSFCGKSSEASRRFFVGPNNAFICDECVMVCVAILYKDDREDCISSFIKIITGENKLQFKNEKTKAKKEET